MPLMASYSKFPLVHYSRLLLAFRKQKTKVTLQSLKKQQIMINEIRRIRTAIFQVGSQVGGFL